MTLLPSALMASILSTESLLLFWLLNQTIVLQELVSGSIDSTDFKPVSKLTRNQLVPDFSVSAFSDETIVTVRDLDRTSNILLFMTSRAANKIGKSVFPSVLGGLSAYIDGKIFVIWCGPGRAIREYADVIADYEVIADKIVFCTDPNGSVASKLQIEVFPCSVLVDEDRRVQKTGTISHAEN